MNSAGRPDYGRQEDGKQKNRLAPVPDESLPEVVPKEYEAPQVVGDLEEKDDKILPAAATSTSADGNKGKKFRERPEDIRRKGYQKSPEMNMLPASPAYATISQSSNSIMDSRPNGETLSGENDQTVTPLHMLGKQADFIDCPFCRRRVETKVKMPATAATHVTAVALGLTTIVCFVTPYLCHWGAHIDHHCTSCNKRVTRRHYGDSPVLGSKDLKIYGTPEEMRQQSRFQSSHAETI